MGEEITRREFVKQTVVGSAALAGGSSGAFALASPPPGDLGHTVVSALGTLFVPSAPGDPGYKELEQFGITDYVLNNFLASSHAPDHGGVETAGAGNLLEEFNNAAKQFFGGKSFLELDEQQREQYLELIHDGSKIADPKLRSQLQTFYRAARTRILTVYYQNYPEHEVKRNAKGEPILKPGDLHQITNPNTKKTVTGWDLAGFKGPMDWEEEEQRRAMMKKILPHWYEGDLIKLTNAKTAAPASKTSNGHDYYDVVVLGGGTAGCIVAGRLAERGTNPKTGDRLRVAMIEGGDDWTIRDPGIRPGYGYPTRRRMITNINYEELGPEGDEPGPAYRWPYAGENFRIVGGCSLHWGGNIFFPTEDDFRFYREASGVDWDLARFGDAFREIEELYHTTVAPIETWAKGDHLWTDAGRALGFEMLPWRTAHRNCLDTRFCGEGHLCKYDSKGTALPWAYLGLNNGLQIIPNAEVEKVLIEKVPGGRPVATGAVYKDTSGTLHEVRAARVIVAAGTVGTPVLLYRSGYGPQEFLGDKLLVENKNVGLHLDGDASAGPQAYFPEPVSADGQGFTGHPYTTMKPRPYGELNVQLWPRNKMDYPHMVALGPFAPGFGWKHKEFMRTGIRRIMFKFVNRLQALPWKWRVTPDGRMQRISLDEQRIDATLREAAELSFAWYDKMAVKPLTIDRRIRRATALRPGHDTGTARAGANREVSVCTSDFDCHDIDHLLITSGASLPRTLFCHGMGPIAVGAAYAWRRMIANHFSRGSSTKGFA